MDELEGTIRSSGRVTAHTDIIRLVAVAASSPESNYRVSDHSSRGQSAGLESSGLGAPVLERILDVVLFFAKAHRFSSDPVVLQGIWHLRAGFKSDFARQAGGVRRIAQ